MPFGSGLLCRDGWVKAWRDLKGLVAVWDPHSRIAVLQASSRRFLRLHDLKTIIVASTTSTPDANIGQSGQRFATEADTAGQHEGGQSRCDETHGTGDAACRALYAALVGIADTFAS